MAEYLSLLYREREGRNEFPVILKVVIIEISARAFQLTLLSNLIHITITNQFSNQVSFYIINEF